MLVLGPGIQELLKGLGDAQQRQKLRLLLALNGPLLLSFSLNWGVGGGNLNMQLIWKSILKPTHFSYL